MLEDWKKKTDEEVFSTVGEQRDSQASYWREVEMKRRHYLLAQQVAASQIEAAIAQKAAASATERTAVWTRASAIAIAVSVIVMAVGVFV